MAQSQANSPLKIGTAVTTGRGPCGPVWVLGSRVALHAQHSLSQVRRFEPWVRWGIVAAQGGEGAPLGAERTGMRRRFTLLAAAPAVALALAAPASAAETPTPVGKFTMTTKITSVRAAGGGLVANGVVVGRLNAGGTMIRDTAPARFRVSQRQRNGRCNILALRLAPVHLALLGVRVDTSHISLDVTARRRGGVLGRLFCALANAKIRFPRPRRRGLTGRSTTRRSSRAPALRCA